MSQGYLSELIAFWMLFRFLCKYDLYFLGTKVLEYGKLVPKRVDPIFHRWFCKEVSKEQNALFLLPRDHTKSTWGIAIKITQDILRNPNVTIMLATKTAQMGIDRLDVVEKHLKMTTLATLYPEILPPNPLEEFKSPSSPYKDMFFREDQIRVKREITRMENTVETISVGQSRPGRHYDKMYIDDVVDEWTIASEQETKATFKFYGGLIPKVDRKIGIIHVFGTPFAPGDMYDWLIEKAGTSFEDLEHINWNVVRRSMMEDRETILSYTPMSERELQKRKGFNPLDQKEGYFIYNYFDTDMLEKTRAELSDDPFFLAQYFCKHVKSDEKVFHPPFREEDSVPDGLEYYCTIDPAFVPSKISDFTAIVVCGYGRKDEIYVTEAIRVKVDVEKLLEILQDVQSRYHCIAIGIEKGAWQTILRWALDYAQKQKGYERLPIKDIQMGNETDAKNKRIRGTAYFVNTGAVIFKVGLNDLKKEMIRYPGNTKSKNDLLDALSMQRELIPWRKKENPLKPPETSRKKTYADFGHFTTKLKVLTGFKRPT